jgi:NAD(P)-dependent dehydrogenase (short-subunit alcohol dehydrogenase family)
MEAIMNLELGGRVAVITGGSDGIGRATAERLAAEGAAVVVCARRPGPLGTLAQTIDAQGGAVATVAMDITAPGAVQALVAAAIDRFGRLDIIVNNAGRSAAHAFDSLDDEAWSADLDLKLHAAVRLIRTGLPHLRASGHGRIINVLAVAGKAPGAGSMPTSVSRAAGLALTKALSKDVARDGITVNAICIGMVKSGQWERRWQADPAGGTLDDWYARAAASASIPLGRVGEATEAADLIAFLASARAAYLTGVAINVDGGLSSAL